MEDQKQSTANIPYNFGMGGFFSPMMMGISPMMSGMMNPMIMQNQNIDDEEKSKFIINQLISVQMQQHQILKLLAFYSMQSDQKMNPMVMQMMGSGFGIGFGSPFGF